MSILSSNLFRFWSTDNISLSIYWNVEQKMLMRKTANLKDATWGLKKSFTYLFVLHAQPLPFDFLDFGTNASGFFISMSFFAFFSCPLASLLVLAHEIHRQLGPQRLPFWKHTQYNLRHLVLTHLHTNFWGFFCSFPGLVFFLLIAVGGDALSFIKEHVTVLGLPGPEDFLATVVWRCLIFRGLSLISWSLLAFLIFAVGWLVCFCCIEFSRKLWPPQTRSY